MTDNNNKSADLFHISTHPVFFVSTASIQPGKAMASHHKALSATATYIKLLTHNEAKVQTLTQVVAPSDLNHGC